MLALFRMKRTGDHVDIPALQARYEGVGWHSFERCAEGQDWEQLPELARAA
jgi:hypothetical protein